MNPHMILLSSSTAFATAADSRRFNPEQFQDASLKEMARHLDFRKIEHRDMPEIWKYLVSAPGRTTDFSYAGLLMWVDYFHYEFAVFHDTLFIKGRVESDISKIAFSLPVGNLPLASSVTILKEYCRLNNLQLEFSAVPESELENFLALHPKSAEPLDDWSDYLYDAHSLANLTGKKYGKKRNHINQFLSAYPDWELTPLTRGNAADAIRFMDRIDAEGDDTPMAVEERRLNREMLRLISEGDEFMEGAILSDGHGGLLGFTIADVKGDTLFVHIEKALRNVPGGFEMLNKSFAAHMLSLHPEIKYINREDDAGDPGLRYAKQSYHPVAMLRKLNVIF